MRSHIRASSLRTFDLAPALRRNRAVKPSSTQTGIRLARERIEPAVSPQLAPHRCSRGPQERVTMASYGGGAGYNEYGQNQSRVGDHDMRIVDNALHGEGIDYTYQARHYAGGTSYKQKAGPQAPPSTYQPQPPVREQYHDATLPSNPHALGDWQCSFCDNVNWAKRAQCHKCQKPRPPPSQRPTIAIGGRGSSILGPNPVSSASSNFLDPRHEGLARRTAEIDWRCPTCDFVNLSGRLTCNQCRIAIPGDGYSAMHGGSLAGYERLRPPQGAGVVCRDSAFDWRCPGCRQQNCSGRWACDYCTQICPPRGYVELLPPRVLPPPPVRVVHEDIVPARPPPVPERREPPLPDVFRKAGTWQEALELFSRRGASTVDAATALVARLGRTRPDSRPKVRGDARFEKALEALDASKLRADQLGDVVTGLGKLGCGKADSRAKASQRTREDACLTEVAAACIHVCPAAKPGDLVTISFGFAIVGSAPRALVRAVAAALETKGPECLGVRETANVLWALEALGAGPASDDAGALFRASLGVLIAAPAKLTERYAGRALWAYRNMRTAASLFENVGKECVPHIAHWTPSAVALLIRAVADAGYENATLADACAKHVTARVGAYGANALVDAAWGLACYGGREKAVCTALEALDYPLVGQAEGDGLQRGGLALLGRTFAACLAPPLRGVDAFARCVARDCHLLAPSDLVAVAESFSVLRARRVAPGGSGDVLVSGGGMPWLCGGAEVPPALAQAGVALRDAGVCDSSTLQRLRGALEAAGAVLPQDFVSATPPTASALDEALALFSEARASKLQSAPAPARPAATDFFEGPPPAAPPPVPPASSPKPAAVPPAAPSSAPKRSAPGDGEEPAAAKRHRADLDAGAVRQMTVPKLKAALTARGLDAKGLKAALQARLLEAVV